MDDEKIVSGLFERNENALIAVKESYGSYLEQLAGRILPDRRDTEECVNDAYLRLWQTIPPQRPKSLRAYAGRIVRNLALDRLDRYGADKRKGEIYGIIEEYAECIPDGCNALEDKIAFRQAVDSFLSGLEKGVRRMFVQRYWYAMSVNEISLDCKVTEANVRVTLYRTRQQFREQLIKEGINL